MSAYQNVHLNIPKHNLEETIKDIIINKHIAIKNIIPVKFDYKEGHGFGTMEAVEYIIITEQYVHPESTLC